MASRRHIRWLLDELPELVGEGVIDEGTADRVREHYETSGPNHSAPTIFAVLGSTFIGLGVLLLIAHNWDELTRGSRAALSIGLLVLAQTIGAITLFRRRTAESVGASEASAVAIVFAVMASIALISQTYHFTGNLDDFLFTCLCLCLPLPYLTASRLAAALYLIGALAWLIAARSGSVAQSGSAYALFVVALLPFLWMCARSQKASFRDHALAVVAAITIPLGGLISLEFWQDRFALPVVAALASAAFASAIQHTRSSRSNAFTPIAGLLGGIVICALTFAFSYGEPWEELAEGARKASMGLPVLATSGIGILCAVYSVRVGLRCLSTGEISQAVFLAIAPILLVAQELLLASGSSVIPTLLLNVYVLTLGIRLMIEGIRDGELCKANLGLVFVGGLIIARFSDMHWSFTVRGMAFIVLGVAFLLLNLRIRKRGTRA